MFKDGISNATRPQNISLGRWIQEWAIEKNKEPRLWGLKKIQARLGAVIAKPAARIIDVALHVGLGVTKCAVGVTIKPIRWVISKITKEELQTNFTVTQGIHHLGLAVLYAVDCPASIAINLLSPGIYEHLNRAWNKLFPDDFSETLQEGDDVNNNSGNFKPNFDDLENDYNNFANTTLQDIRNAEMDKLIRNNPAHFNKGSNVVGALNLDRLQQNDQVYNHAPLPPVPEE